MIRRQWIRKQWIGAGLAAALMVFAASAQAQVTTSLAGPGPGDAGANRWVATWSAAPQMPGDTTIDSLLFDQDHSRSFTNQTIRHVVHTSVGGRKVRVRLSNAFGYEPLRVGAVQVALSNSMAAVYPGGRRLTFNGQASVMVPAGAVAVSDAVDFNVPADGDLAVGVYLPGETEPATYHETTTRDSYIAAEGSGNLTAAADLPGATTTFSTFYLSVVEVQAADPIGTLVALGDSITQGFGSTQNQNRSWPDKLSDRLNTNPARPRLAVINQGIGCGRLLYDFCGPSGAARFDRDVAAVTGASGVIVHLGLNDIMIPALLPLFGQTQFGAEVASAADIINGLQQLAQRARARGLKVFGATLTPFGSSGIPGLFTPENEAKRQAVNRWIRTSGAFDGVVDFEAAVRDPANPSRTLPAYDFDGVHLNDAGYAAMANAVNLSMLF